MGPLRTRKVGGSIIRVLTATMVIAGVADVIRWPSRRRRGRASRAAEFFALAILAGLGAAAGEVVNTLVQRKIDISSQFAKVCPPACQCTVVESKSLRKHCSHAGRVTMDGHSDSCLKLGNALLIWTEGRREISVPPSCHLDSCAAGVCRSLALGVALRISEAVMILAPREYLSHLA